MVNVAPGEVTDARDGHAIGNGWLVAATKERATVLIEHVGKVSQPLGKFVLDEVDPHRLDFRLALLGLGVVLRVPIVLRPQWRYISWAATRGSSR